MKRVNLLMWVALMLCCLVPLTFTSCSDDDNITEGNNTEKETWPDDIDYSQWMQHLDNNRLVANLSLPGAHDAVTAEGWYNMPAIMEEFAEGMAKCQDLTIQELLEKGVRVFDLRPERVSKTDNTYELRCTHGVMATNLLVVDFFRKLQTYLAAHPTEFCIVTIQLSATSDKTAWGNEFYALITDEEFQGLFADFKPRLTVGEMRGKVLLLSQEKYAEHPVGGYCEGWTSELELEQQQQGRIIGADGSETPLWVQDYWEDITRENKDAAVKNMLEAAVTRDLQTATPAWVINFPSAYIGGPFSNKYRENAAAANVVTINWLAEHTGSVGIIYMDFAAVETSKAFQSDNPSEYNTAGMRLVDSVIRQNIK